MNLLKVRINSAKKFSEFSEVTSLTLPTVNGEVEILPDHMPLITELDQGEIRILFKDGKEQSFLANRGYAKISDDDVILLLDEVDQTATLVKEEIQKAIENAENMVANSDLPPSELIQLEKRLRYERFKLNQVK